MDDAEDAWSSRRPVRFSVVVPPPRDWRSSAPGPGKGHLGKTCPHVADDPGESRWLAGDMADAVWVAPGAPSPSEQEILRVLHPGGVCVAAGNVVEKPRPPAWMSGAIRTMSRTTTWCRKTAWRDCRGVAVPDAIRSSRPMPNQTLFAGGRIFFFSGHIAFHEREEPLLNTLTVLNAYNGLRLWSRPLDPELRRPQSRRSWRPAARWSLPRAARSGCWMRRPGERRQIQRSGRGRRRRATPTGNGLPRRRTSSGRRWARRMPASLPIGRSARWATGPGTWPTRNTRASSTNFGAARRLAAFSIPR